VKWSHDSGRLLATADNGLKLVDSEIGRWHDAAIRGTFNSQSMGVVRSADGRTPYFGGSQNEADNLDGERR
jgi:hypothetical protein